MQLKMTQKNKRTLHIRLTRIIHGFKHWLEGLSTSQAGHLEVYKSSAKHFAPEKNDNKDNSSIETEPIKW